MFGKPSATTRRIWTVVATLAVCFALLPMAPALAATAYTLTINDVAVDEATTPAAFTVTLAPAAGAGTTVTVNYATANGTAAAPGDFTAASGTLTFTAGQSVKTVNVPIINDTVDEAGAETYSVLLSGALSTGAGDTFNAGDPTGIGTITDNDPAPTITASSPAALEAAGALTFILSLSNPSDSTVTVYYQTTAGSATAGADYTTIAGWATFAPGIATQTVVVPVINDANDESNETFSLDLGPAFNAGGLVNGIGTILDDDTPILSVNSPSFVENLGPWLFTLTLDRAPDPLTPPTVQWNLTNGTALAGADYLAPFSGTTASGCFVLVVGVYTCTVAVTPNDDLIVEPDETFSMILSNPLNAIIGTGTGVATILDDDSEPTINVSSQSVSEAAGTMDFIVSLTSAYTKTITVRYWTSNVTAVQPGDYTQVHPTSPGYLTLTFLPGETSKTVPVTIINDTLDEANETFWLNIGTAVNAKLPALPYGIGTIIDDDTPTISINTPASVNEGAGTITFTVSLNSAPVGAPVSVQYQTVNGTALSPGDFTALALTTLNWAIGDGAAKTFTVTIADDLLDEIDETFTVVLSNAIGGNIATGTGTGTILDNDAAPTLSINSPAGVSEDAVAPNNIVFTISLSAASGKTITVNYASANGTATAGADYTAGSGTLTFAAGELTKTVSIPVLNDTAYEMNETFTVDLSNPVNATLLAGSGTGTILNVDPKPTISVVPLNPSAPESAGTLGFVVTLDRVTYEQVTVQYGDGACGVPQANWALNTPTPGPQDYVPSAGWTTLVFNPGAPLSQTVSFAVLNDGVDEPNEQICMTFNPLTVQNGLLPTLAFAGTILDDDLPVVSVALDATNPAVPNPCGPGAFPTAAGYSSSPEGSVMLFVVYLDQSPLNQVSVDFATANGTATAGSDYAAQSGTLIFPAGATGAQLCKWIPSEAGFALTDDTADEPNETILMNLSNVSGATIGVAQVTGTIEDNDPTQLSISDAAVVEGTDASGLTTTLMRFTITGTSALAAPEVLAFTVTAGSAGAADFSIPGSPTISGAGPWYLDFQITKDTIDELDEFFTVTLTDPSPVNGYNLGAKPAGIGTILDDDTATVSINDVSVVEGNGLAVNLVFTVTLSNAFDNAAGLLFVNYASLAGTALEGIDYLPAAGLFAFIEGGALTVTLPGIAVTGDLIDEETETFTMPLTANAANPGLGFTKAVGIGTILDNDPDVTPPVLTLPANMTVEATGPTGRVVSFTATATDAPHANPPVTCLPPSGSTFPLGTTTVNCSTTDASSLTTTGSFTITVVDTTPPIITMLGTSPMVVLMGGMYTDAGATAADIVDGDITAWIVTVNPVDTAIAGTYLVTYNVTDSHGNPAAQVTRTVEVVYACGGLQVTILGTAGDDALLGTAGDDVIVALDGHDTINGLGGNDIICGGPGNDMIYGGEGSDTIYANAGSDYLYGEGGDDMLFGGAGNDRLFGGAGDDDITGGAGFDLVDYSGAGMAMTVDLFAQTASGDGADYIVSVERLIGSAFDDTLTGGPADNTIWGGDGNDTIYGLGGNDQLYGQNGDDTIYGNGGDDSLYGGPGDDMLIGGLGDDLYDGIPE